MKLAVVGTRTFNDYELFKSHMDCQKNISVIISGGAAGADAMAERYAKENNIPIEIYYADWERLGKAAGFIRNRLIWEFADSGIAFWDGKSKGTLHSLKLSKLHNKPLQVVKYEN